MAVVDVGVVRVEMFQPRMLMPAGMWLPGRIFGTMFVLVVLVMKMEVLVLQRFMDVAVFMLFGDMKPYAGEHEQAGDEQGIGIG